MHGRSDHERAAVLLAQVAVRMGVVGEIPRGKIAQSYPKQAVILLERGTRQVVVRMGGCMKTHDRKSINLIRKMLNLIGRLPNLETKKRRRNNHSVLHSASMELDSTFFIFAQTATCPRHSSGRRRHRSSPCRCWLAQRVPDMGGLTTSTCRVTWHVLRHHTRTQCILPEHGLVRTIFVSLFCEPLFFSDDDVAPGRAVRAGRTTDFLRCRAHAASLGYFTW